MSSTSSSYQLPDLLSLFQGYHEMSVNKHCRAASSASQEWIRGLAQEGLESPALPPDNELTSMKLGLLGACCFPSCDLTQLILIIDVWSLIVLDTRTVLRSDPPTRCDWNLANENCYPGFLELLQAHPLFERLSPRLSRFRESTSEWWQQRFARSIATHRSSQQRAIDYRRAGSVPRVEIDEYMNFRRDLGGLNIILDLIEAVEGLDLDVPIHNEKLCTMRRLAGDIIVLTWDVFSYNIDQSLDNKLNIVCVLQSEREAGLASSINEAGNLIRQRLEQFKALEDSLLLNASAPLGNATSTTFSLSWLWNNTPKIRGLPDSTLISQTQVHDVGLYVRELKDCMVGFLNWAYETDMFFKTKGESVKSFGWVFLSPPNPRANSTASATAVE